MHSNFDLEIEAKTPEEKKYHDFMLPLMHAMVSDRNLTSLRALHPVLNPGFYTRANAIAFEYPDESSWINFLSSFNLHFLSLATFWKNWRSITWRSLKTESGPFKTRENADGKFYYIVDLEVKAKPESVAAYTTAAGALIAEAVSSFKDSSLVEVSHWEAMGHSHASHRLSFEFDDFAAVGKLFALSTWRQVAEGGLGPHGSLSWAARDVVVAPAPVSLATAEAQRAAYEAARAAAGEKAEAKQ